MAKQKPEKKGVILPRTPSQKESMKALLEDRVGDLAKDDESGGEKR